MEVSREALQERYARMDTDDLLNLYRPGMLTAVATEVLREELTRRGVSIELLEQNIRREEEAEIRRAAESAPKDALKRIKGAVAALYVIAGLQCLMSVAFQFWAGVAFGVVLAVLAAYIGVSKSPGAGVAVAIMGGIASILNFLGPLVTGVRSGNLVLSLVAVWLGVRIYKAARVWMENKPTPNTRIERDAR